MEINFKMLEFHIGNVSVLKNMPDLSADQPFSAQRIDFLNQVSRELLSDKEAKAYPDVVTFAFWIRKGNMEKYKEQFKKKNDLRMGRGIVFHIAPSNVAVNYAYSFAVGFVLGNANIVRLPSKDFPQIERINDAVRKILERTKEGEFWKDYIVFLRYGKEKEINDYFSFLCDVRVIWGGDATIREIRKSELRPRVSEITFADRYSLCLMDAETYLSETDKEKIASDFYNDTYLTDQNACTSPRMVCWLGNKKEAEKAKEVFWDLLWNLVEKKYDFQPVQSMDKLTEGCMAVMHMDGIHRIKMRDNRIVRMELEKIDVRVQEYRGHSGFFYEYTTKDVTELAPLCNAKLQTIAFMGRKEQLMPLIKAGIRGIDRIVTIGRTMDFEMVWDGMDLEERMTRKITCTVE